MIFFGLDTLRKIQEDANQWFQAQELERLDLANDLATNLSLEKKWSPSDKNWVKCNIASALNKTKLERGVAWVLRNDRGMVLLHGRRSFSSINSRLEASLESWLWEIESVKSLRLSRVVFAAEDKDLIGAVNRPPAWPSFKFYSTILLDFLAHIPVWKLLLEHRATYMGALLVANYRNFRELVAIIHSLWSPFLASRFFWLGK